MEKHGYLIALFNHTVKIFFQFSSKILLFAVTRDLFSGSTTMIPGIYKLLSEASCEVYCAPFDVRFPDYLKQKESEITNVVQPDLVVICDKEKLDDKGCIGAPDLVIEILSP